MSKLKLLLALAASALIAACGGDDDTNEAPRVTEYPGGVWEPGPARYGFVTVNDSVALMDGVVLTARVSYPTDLATGTRAAGNFPVIVEHTPYPGGQGTPVPAEAFSYFTQRGYIYAEVRARGTGTSAGEVQYSGPRDGEDGKEIANWAATRLSGSDGRVALIGCSYPAWIALQTASRLGPNSPVKAIVAACNGFDSQNRGTFMRAGLQNSNMRAMRSLGPLLGNTPSAIRFFNDLAVNIESGGDAAYERAFWKERVTIDMAGAIAGSGIPILLWSGWQDRVEGAVRTYTALQNAYAGRPLGAPMVEGQRTTPRYQLIMGDWGHAAGLDNGVYLQWIETWLKGTDTGIQRTSTPMHLSDPGTGGWANLGRFPTASENTRWFLAPTGTLGTAVPPSGGSTQLTWQDPALPGGLVSFSTPPLAQGTTLSGAISTTIYASSSNTNLMLVNRLYDVAPDGSATLISMGAVLGSLSELDPAKSWTDNAGTVTWPWPRLDADRYLTPNQVYRFDISLLSRHWSIKPNHRLRLDITGQNPPALCTANTSGTSRSRGMDACILTPQQQATVPGGTYMIRTGPQWPSALNLPQVPFNTFPMVRAGIVPTETSAAPATKLVLPLDWGTASAP